MYKRIFFLLVIIAVSFQVVSCGDGDKPVAYCEMRIPLEDGFYSVENENFDATYTNGKYLVAILRISFVAGIGEGIPETLTPYEFGEFWLDKCERYANMISDGVAYCEYYDTEGDTEHFYLEAFYRSRYAYFVVLFGTDSARESDGRVDFLSYAQGVYFTD